MLSLFKFRRANLFRLYSLLFACVAFVERYILYEISQTCRQTFFPFFYETNFIRLCLLVFPFLIFCFIRRTGVIETFISNLPFLFFSLVVLAIPTFQPVYFLTALFFCLWVDKLRKFACVTALVFIGFLIIPNYISGTCESAGAVKANMYMLQMLVETYAIDNAGIYPESASHLKKTAIAQGYWRKVINPFTGEEGTHGDVFIDVSDQEFLLAIEGNRKTTIPKIREFFGIRLNNGYSEKSWKGKVIYQKLASNRYAIYGVGHRESQLLQDRGIPFILTNAQ